ncbi:amidohydrolase [Flavobacteriaceae bacterium Ap0902]|nr:amidohydrolase [Flavobacteriaceae bacterium Ap0902]
MQNFTQLRKEFHQIAELSGKEFQTSQKVREVLEDYNCEIVSPIGSTGVLAIFDSCKEGETVTFRAELDALPIQEINTFEHKSATDGVSHKCGHDGHLTSLLNLAEKLNQNPPTNGRVILLFQSAEENGEGALAMLRDEQFKNYHPDYIFAYHNLPGYPIKEVVYKYDSFTAAVVSIIIKLNGRTAHAAEPEHGENPAKAMAHIMLRSLEQAHNDINHPEFSVVTPVYETLGAQDYGISAGYGEVHLTLRCWTQKALDVLIQEIENIAKEEANKEKLEVSFEYTQAFQSNENNEQAVSILEEVLKEKHYENQKRAYPFKWGEDFGLFTQNFKGAMFGIGSGENCPALHNPDYDFPDELLDYASDLFFDIQKSILG